MKDYMPGLIISLIIYIILELVNWQVYNNVMPFGVLISFLVSYVIVSKHNIDTRKTVSAKRRILGYITYVFIFLLCVYFSLPELTFNQAKEKVLNNHDITIEETYNVPLLPDNEWNPFETNWAYFFEGVNSMSEKISIMVIPDTGKVFVMD
ncbi:hypothetical protein JSQ81_11220 [Sporosarcina sp. Marseille-Q4063]|uniref:hypothetical protein n=1 Tax=Sporosarcina sp. Marseille-Q4063 TaxID=2810514 RepID=UPI001BAFE51A|nr:hypothetical protein [Sporosarcina sp. Marseille-Q4063]QUW20432.1 hypothetical protein JSQ81_11220 [Sporosarcina sp. Marseille-Q4063]